MTYIDLEQIENISKKRKILNFLKEIVLFALVNLSVFVIWMIIINFNAFKLYFYQYLWYDSRFNNKIVSIEEKVHSAPDNVKKKKIILKRDEKKQIAKLERYYKKLLEEKLNRIKYVKKLSLYEKNLDKYLKIKQKNYKFAFNLLPPGKRILIPAIGVDAPIIDLKFISPEKLTKGDFDEYLYKWVVKYPYTPNPWQTGNILIFWHTSYYWWKKNPYGDIFAKIPLLRHGDIIEIIWDWKVYKYKIFKKLVRRPWQVKYTYEYYNKMWKILTVMWCYPIWTDRQRMLIIAKQINNLWVESLAFKN